jgi:hypothetical protein
MSETKVVENQNTRFMFSNFSENRAVYEIMWKNITEPDRPQMHIECWIAKAIDTHSEYVIRIVFPLQKRLRERAVVLRLYVHCLPY